MEQALAKNGRHHKARQLKISLLRHRGERESALSGVAEALRFDPMEYGALWEQHLLQGDPAFAQVTHLKTDTLIELALDYAHAGLFHDAAKLLNEAVVVQPMLKYTLGWIQEQAGEPADALQSYKEAADLAAGYCFPNRLEDVLSLSAAMRLNPADARAPYYLGNFWYAHRRHEEAIVSWEQARDLDEQFPTVHRNLGLAYYNKLTDPQRALQSLDTAFALNPHDARVLYELDQLYKKLNYAPARRLAFLEEHLALVQQRDDLAVERITLLNLLGRPGEALDLLLKRSFHPWEGGEGKVTRQYAVALVELARQDVERGEFATAVLRLHQAQEYPHNLGEGKLYGAQENNISYYLGCAYEGMGDADHARAWYERAAVGLSEPTTAVFYNDQPPDMIYYQGLARERLGQFAEAREMYQRLVDYGQSHMQDDPQIDYFAISLPNFLVFDEDLRLQNQIHCHYMIVLGAMGLGDEQLAQAHFKEVLTRDANHLGATLHGRLA